MSLAEVLAEGYPGAVLFTKLLHGLILLHFMGWDLDLVIPLGSPLENVS